MAEVAPVISASARLNEVVRQAQVRKRDGEQTDDRINVIRVESESRARETAIANQQRLDDIDFQRELDLQRQVALDARIRDFEATDERERARDLPRGSIVDVLA